MLSEEKIKEILIPVFMKQDQASIHWPDIFEEVRAIESAVLAEQAKQEPVAFISKNVVSGTSELCWVPVGSAHDDRLYETTKLYAAPVVQQAPEGMTKRCEWHHCGDEYMPGTWDGECGAKWTFTEDGPVENNMRFCPECGGEVVVAAAEKEAGK